MIKVNTSDTIPGKRRVVGSVLLAADNESACGVRA